MTVAVRGRVPTNSEGKFTDKEASHIAERLRALERALAGSAPQFLSPAAPTFGGGVVGAPGSGGGVIPPSPGGGGTTIINNLDETWTRKFLLMGA